LDSRAADLAEHRIGILIDLTRVALSGARFLHIHTMIVPLVASNLLGIKADSKFDSYGSSGEFSRGLVC
jgi:hypothetical protein